MGRIRHSTCGIGFYGVWYPGVESNQIEVYHMLIHDDQLAVLLGNLFSSTRHWSWTPGMQ
jgi:hypothetical protein